MSGGTFKCQCGLRIAVPRFTPRPPADTDGGLDSTGARGEPQNQRPPRIPQQSDVHELKNAVRQIDSELSRANQNLKECRLSIRKRKKATEELKLAGQQLLSPAICKAMRLLMTILGLVPGWIIADATVGILGVVVFCPMSILAFHKVADLMGFQVYRPREVLLSIMRTGEIAEAQLSDRQRQVDELIKRHNHTVEKAKNADRAYKAELRRQADLLRIEREREERLARTPKPINLQSTPRVDVSEALALGKGREWVYAYSFPSHIVSGKFPIKVGMTSRPDVVKRIDEQMTGTSMPERAKVLLVFRVPNGLRAEKAFHSALKSKGQHKSDAVGTEWFKTTPNELLELYVQISDSDEL